MPCASSFHWIRNSSRLKSTVETVYIVRCIVSLYFSKTVDVFVHIELIKSLDQKLVNLITPFRLTPSCLRNKSWKSRTHTQISMTVSTEYATSTESRNPDSSVSRDTNSSCHVCLIWILTGEFAFVDLMEFGVEFPVISDMCSCIYLWMCAFACVRVSVEGSQIRMKIAELEEALCKRYTYIQTNKTINHHIYARIYIYM